MKARHHGLTPHTGDPFKECKLKRRQYALILTGIVQNYKDGFVLAINNKWGAGKTTFVQMWQQHLENESFKTVYFNAWKNDLGDSILPALLSELEGIDRPESGSAASLSFAQLVEKAAPLAKAAIPVLTKLAVERFAGEGSISKMAEAFATGGGEMLSAEMQGYKARKAGLEQYKTALEAFVQVHTSNGKPLIFIIDELDRCRPNYAVMVLEHIKHLFCVHGLVFVLSIDKEQLGHAVRGVYGSESLNAQEYLRRFIDLEYSLPAPDYLAFSKYLFGYFDLRKFNSSQPTEWDYFEEDDFIEFASKLMSSVDATLRQQEKLFARMKVVESVSTGGYHLQMILFLLLFTEEFRPDFFQRIKSRSVNNSYLLEEFGTIFGNQFNSNECSYHAVTVTFLYVTYYVGDIRKSLSSQNAKDQFLISHSGFSNIHMSQSSKASIPQIAAKYSMLTEGKPKLWKQLIEKISLSESFSK